MWLVILFVILILIGGTIGVARESHKEKSDAKWAAVAVENFRVDASREKSEIEASGAKISKTVYGNNSALYVDDNSKTWYEFTRLKNTVGPYKYSDILGIDVRENGGSVMQGNGGGALAGGLLFGVTGAVIGAATETKASVGTCESLIVYLSINDLQNAQIEMPIITRSTLKSSPEYRQAMTLANEIVSVVAYMQKNA